MNTMPGIFTSSATSEECRQVLNSLMFDWPEEPSDDESSAFLSHLCHCRDCLRKWIALEAAADLAGFSLNDEANVSRDEHGDNEDSTLSKSLAPRTTAGSRPERDGTLV